MAGVYAHNRLCDARNWVGETVLDGFEKSIFVDDVISLTPFENYEESMEDFWPRFIEDSTIL